MGEVIALRRDLERESIRKRFFPEFGGPNPSGHKIQIPFENDRKLGINIRLAHVIGMVHSVVLDEIDFWIKCSNRGVAHEGWVWIGLTYDEWESELGNLWSITTIRKVIKDLRDLKILLVERLGDHPTDRTNYYAVDHDRIYELCEDYYGDKVMEGQ